MKAQTVIYVNGSPLWIAESLEELQAIMDNPAGMDARGFMQPLTLVWGEDATSPLWVRRDAISAKHPATSIVQE